MLLTTAAYLFRDTQGFEEPTKTMILTYSGSCMDISCGDVESAINCKVLCKFPDNKTGNIKCMTNLLMHKPARRGPKLCKAETSINTHRHNKRPHWTLCSQVRMVKQICICLYGVAQKLRPLANTLV